MKLRPLHDRVIVKRLEQETKTASGIVIPDNAAENYVFCCHLNSSFNAYLKITSQPLRRGLPLS